MRSFFFARYPLQSITEFQIQTNPKHTIAFIVGLGLLVGIIVYLNVSKAVKKTAAFQGKGIKSPLQKKLQNASFFKLVKMYKLSKAEAAFLEKNLKEAGARDFEIILRSKTKTDEYCKRIYQQIIRDQNAEEAEAELLKAVADPQIGILLISEKLAVLCRETITNRKLHFKQPLIEEVPDRDSKGGIVSALERYVGEAVGIKI